jgi:hypothetical protein
MAFEYCNALAKVTCLAETPPRLDYYNNFDRNNADVLHVPAGSLADYQGSAEWSSAFDGNIEAIQ